MLESQIVGVEQRNPHILVYLHRLEPQRGAYLEMHKTATEQLQLDFSTKQISYDTKNNQ